MANRPAVEVDITEQLARNLLREQAPDLASQPLQLLGRGFDNTNWRLGDDLIVRLPHRAEAAPLVVNEQRWLPELSPLLHLAIPAPVFSGQPSVLHDYPFPWSIVPWIDGAEAAGATLTQPAATAEQLGRFLHQLHTAAVPDDGPTNPHRGGDIREKRGFLVQRCDMISDRVDVESTVAMFDQAAAALPTDERVWLHGDMHLRNLIVDQGELRAVIDWGDICTGDRATDLCAAFMLVPGHIDIVAEHAGADDHAWRRARGWAIHFGVMYLAMAEDDPVQYGIGEDLLRSLGIAVR